MARRRKTNLDIDLDELADKIAERLSSRPVHPPVPNKPFTLAYPEELTFIEMDESIIPSKVVDIGSKDTHVSESIKEEKSVDADLEKSKNKLASILKKKGK